MEEVIVPGSERHVSAVSREIGEFKVRRCLALWGSTPLQDSCEMQQPLTFVHLTNRPINGSLRSIAPQILR